LTTASATWRQPAQRESFIFGDSQRKLATARATRIFYLWRQPAQFSDGRATRIFYLWRRPAQLGDGLRNAYLLSLMTASATWRWPAQF